ncbi:hypothetical protein EZV62_007626 [Acer yangbiense]|uniref:Uncharacterized protein n=1 Tax=Acer yangbiense TaxID=1000413 RepID=A0A5C7IB77_9ROSI|nr:hypothetical protein EZV62_007626 [Acer yangbiense]
MERKLVKDVVSKDLEVTLLSWLDGLGLGLILHHKLLGKAFEVMYLHIPVHDRTSFEDDLFVLRLLAQY